MLPSSNSSFNKPAQPNYQVARVVPQRPTGVTVLAILKLLSVVLAVLLIWLYQGEIQSLQAELATVRSQPAPPPGTVVVNAGVQDMLEDMQQNRISTLWLSQIMTGLEIPFSLLLAWGLWTMRRWARTWTLAIAWLSVGLGVVGMCLAGELNLPLGIALNGVVIWYLMRQDVQDAFDPGSI